MNSDTTTATWFDLSRDPAYKRILKATRRDARKDIPDVTTTPDSPPRGLDEIVNLTLERAHNLRIAAYAAAAPYVEEAVAIALTVHGLTAPMKGQGIPELQTSRGSRAAAVQASAITHMYELQQKVVTATEIHHDDVEGLRRFGVRCLANLDQAIRANHRFAQHLTYVIPDIELPEDIYEIGLARVRAALNDLDATTDATTEETTKEDVA